jgi:hypothetical protein
MTQAVPHAPTTPSKPAAGLSLTAWCVVAAFGAYFCTYGFRKPFTAASYELTFGGVALKTLLVAAQVAGYTLSKFIGIKFVAEAKPSRRAAYLVALAAAAEASLLLFALTPPPFNAAWLVLNGLALGVVFGLVMGFLEGRRRTEALVAALCASFIVADGVMKSAGAYLLKLGVGEFWMPAAAGLLFLPGLLLFAWMLSRIPAPSEQDVAARGRRPPIDGGERWRFFRRYALGLTLLVLVYLLVTVLRSVRADFAPEIWGGLGVRDEPAVFTWSEMVVAAAVLLLTGSTVLIRDNRRAFFAAMALAVAGAGLVAVALAGLSAGLLSPFGFMALQGLGLYLPYVAVHVTLFERLLAMTRDRGNVGYLMYLADAFGYLGYVVVLVAKNLAGGSGDFLPFYRALAWVIAAACVALLLPCWLYFAAHPATRRPEVMPVDLGRFSGRPLPVEDGASSAVTDRSSMRN